MKLYTYDAAPNPARLKMFIDYKGIHVDTEVIDMMKLEQQSEDYVKLVPEATVPALVLEDGTVLTAIIAIAQYLESLHPERPLMGVTPREKALVLNWCQRIFNTTFMGVAEVFRNSNPNFENRSLPGTTPYPQIPALVERGKVRLIDSLQRINAELEDGHFLTGSSITLADIDLLAAIEFAKWAAKVTPDPALTRLADWRARTEDALGR
ncbi:glutathione S-transferase, C-terminal domain [Luminiphilus syltensis NOR5-1B]|uniref:Glutathione S-transferase, C-terminal domain n=1 Tax=Luminiphilus syltensis NOR5-1B TaxID=565045 RepID=B8KSW2_9GAMM|nr:glutathione S-transferase family protein [Luminiphilus syltensis]EED35764.1 glutathione S-transferase, C-terminal domain [Luminiphilus syltensis NOR5-1B]